MPKRPTGRRTRDETAGAWRLETDQFSWEQMGKYRLTADTVFTDTVDHGAHTTLADCMAAHDFIYANVTVKDGAAVSVEVVDIF